MVSKQDHDGWLPLHHAMRHDASPETVRYLLDGHPEHVQVTDKDGRTPLHVASRRSKLTAMKVLLEGIPELVRVSDNNGRTALHRACQCGRSKNTIAFLLDGNMDLIEMSDNKGRSILHAACCRKNFSIDLGVKLHHLRSSGTWWMKLDVASLQLITKETCRCTRLV